MRWSGTKVSCKCIFINGFSIQLTFQFKIPYDLLNKLKFIISDATVVEYKVLNTFWINEKDGKKCENNDIWYFDACGAIEYYWPSIIYYFLCRELKCLNW